MNKLYLKVGVALTAAFAFGYLVGTEFAIRKMQEMMGKKADDFELVKQEFVFQAAHQKSEEPEKEEEEDDMARRKPKEITVTESFHFDIPYELVVDEFGLTLGETAEEWAKSSSTAAERVNKALELFMEQEDEQMIKAISEIQRHNTLMEIRDITPYPLDNTMRKFRMVYIHNANRLYWRIGDWRDKISNEEICDILIRLMTFSVVRYCEEDSIVFPTTWTPILLMSEEGVLPGDDPELYNTRIFTLSDLGIEVEILIEPTEPYPGRVDALLEAHWEDE